MHCTLYKMPASLRMHEVGFGNFSRKQVQEFVCFLASQSPIHTLPILTKLKLHSSHCELSPDHSLKISIIPADFHSYPSLLSHTHFIVRCGGLVQSLQKHRRSKLYKQKYPMPYFLYLIHGQLKN
jgi:hypothetical protein